MSGYSQISSIVRLAPSRQAGWAGTSRLDRPGPFPLYLGRRWHCSGGYSAFRRAGFPFLL